MPDLHRPLARLQLRQLRRGFTLLELIAVVVIIAILSVVAMPAIADRLRDRRTNQTAQEIANLYRSARARAMGRGSAVLVRWDGSSNPPQFVVKEAVRGGSITNCTEQPMNSCLSPTWAEPVGTVSDNRRIANFVPNGEVSIQAYTGDATPLTASQMDVCFTPLGRAYARYDFTTSPPPQLVGVPKFDVVRKLGATTYGLTRTVLVLPTGAARLDVAH